VTKKTKRLYLIAAILVFAATAVTLTLSALKTSITYFYMPSDIATMAQPPASAIRLGGLVEAGSVKYLAAQGGGEKQSIVEFNVTDGASTIKVDYAGLLPDLFREGQGVIVQGRFSPDGATLTADNVLAKHDENYMPKEVADALKEKGLWIDDDQAK